MQSLNFLFEQIKKIAQILIDNPEIIKDKGRSGNKTQSRRF